MPVIKSCLAILGGINYMKSKKVKKEKSFNAFDVIAESFTSLKQKQTKAFLGSVFVLALVSLVFGIMYGLTKSLTISGVAVSFVYGILLIPFINFMCNVAEGRGALEDMFQKDQYTLSNVLIGFVFSAAVLFGVALLVVPAFIVATLFIFALPIASNTTSKCFDAFIKAKELSKGFRGRILSVLLIYLAIFIVCIGLGLGLSALIFLLIFKMFGWWVIGLVAGILAFLIFFIPYFILSVVYLYDNTIAEKRENGKNNNSEPKEYSQKEETVNETETKAIDVQDIKNIENFNSNNSNPFDYSDIIRY